MKFMDRIKLKDIDYHRIGLDETFFSTPCRLFTIHKPFLKIKTNIFMNQQKNFSFKLLCTLSCRTLANHVQRMWRTPETPLFNSIKYSIQNAALYTPDDSCRYKREHKQQKNYIAYFNRNLIKHKNR